MTGYTHLRFSCDYYNNTDGIGAVGRRHQRDVRLPRVLRLDVQLGRRRDDDDAPGDPTDVDGVMSYTHGCQVLANDAGR